MGLINKWSPYKKEANLNRQRQACIIITKSIIWFTFRQKIRTWATYIWQHTHGMLESSALLTIKFISRKVSYVFLIKDGPFQLTITSKQFRQSFESLSNSNQDISIIPTKKGTRKGYPLENPSRIQAKIFLSCNKTMYLSDNINLSHVRKKTHEVTLTPSLS
jgi:hypothetical protein